MSAIFFFSVEMKRPGLVSLPCSYRGDQRDVHNMLRGCSPYF